MKKLGLILCVVILSTALFACGNNEFPYGDNFSPLQRSFYNDTIKKVNEFIDLTDETLDLSRDINENLHLSVYVNKIDSIDLLLASMLAQGIVTQEEANNFSAECKYMLEFSIRKTIADTYDDSIGFRIYCFKDNNSAKDFYNWEPAKNKCGETLTLNKNLVMYSSGNLSYDKNQIISALNNLKDSI